jgi:hypothetical protein
MKNMKKRNIFGILKIVNNEDFADYFRDFADRELWFHFSFLNKSNFLYFFNLIFFILFVINRPSNAQVNEVVGWKIVEKNVFELRDFEFAISKGNLINLKFVN